MFNRVFLRIKNSIWLMPALLSLTAFLLAVAVVWLDIYYLEEASSVFPSIFLVSVDLAQTILGTIAGSLLTMTTITFSIIMVVLTTYSSQFSPRTLQNFIKDHVTMRVLGIFIGGFVYSIFSLLFMRERSVDNHVGAASVGVLIAFICVAIFAYFIHHVASSVQVSMLIERLAKDSLETINKRADHIKENEHISLLHVPPVPPINLSKNTNIRSEQFGYIQLINEKKLFQKANEQECYIEISKKIGDFTLESKPVMTVFYGDQSEAKLDGQDLTIGKERTTMQDTEFGLQKITEVALRAVSPGINDPNTAIQCIRHLGLCLRAASEIDGSYLVYYDKLDRPAVSIPQRPFEDLLRSSFYQIAHYGKNDISVITAIFDALYDIAEDHSVSIKEKTVKFSDYLVEKIDPGSFTKLDKEIIKNKKSRLDELLE
ncbi:DUF2254 family protein [Mesobacillus harenae]|uniref:DUF2254 family protein n=1 Tax=Mesobacillus harenae TaxID=2213203 RepID=UPI001580F427